MSQLLTDAVCGETVPAWVETVEQLDTLRCSPGQGADTA